MRSFEVPLPLTSLELCRSQEVPDRPILLHGFREMPPTDNRLTEKLVLTLATGASQQHEAWMKPSAPVPVRRQEVKSCLQHDG